MTDIDIEWKDVEKKVEEDEFKKEKAAEYQQQQSDQKTEQQKTETTTEDKDKFESVGLADIVSETWNSIAVDKGYEVRRSCIGRSSRCRHRRSSASVLQYRQRFV